MKSFSGRGCFKAGPSSGVIITFSTSLGSTIFALRASDPDVADEGQTNLQFSFTAANANFGVTEDGYVYTKTALDYETTTAYPAITCKLVYPPPPVLSEETYRRMPSQACINYEKKSVLIQTRSYKRGGGGGGGGGGGVVRFVLPFDRKLNGLDYKIHSPGRPKVHLIYSRYPLCANN